MAQVLGILCQNKVNLVALQMAESVNDGVGRNYRNILLHKRFEFGRRKNMILEGKRR